MRSRGLESQTQKSHNQNHTDGLKIIMTCWMEQEIFFADDQEHRLGVNENDVHIEINVIDDIPFEIIRVEEAPPEVKFFHFYWMTISL